MTTKIKIGIVGSRAYTNKQKVKDLLFEIKQKYGDEVEIVSGGQKLGADGFAKKYALELDCNYVEVNPAHTPKNLYSYMREEWYGKKYSPKNFYVRNKILAKSIDRLIAFVPEGDSARGTANTVNYAVEYNKKVIVIT